MKLTEAKSRASGVRIGEMEANLLSPNPILKAKVMLVDKEGLGYGMYTASNVWSEKTLEALQNLLNQMEEDALQAVFEVGPTPDEPQQF